MPARFGGALDSATSTPPHPRLRWLLSAGAPPIGWFLYDVAVFARSGEPRVIVDLLPMTSAIVAAFLVIGSILGVRPRLAHLVLALAVGVGLGAPALFSSPVSPTTHALPRVAALLLLCVAVTELAARHTRLGALRAGLALGLGAGLATAFYRGTAPEGSVALTVSAGVLLGSGFLRPPFAHAATLLVLLAVGWSPTTEAIEDQRLGRPDLVSWPDKPRDSKGSPNLLLIVLDTVRADHLTTYGHTRDTMPALDRLTREHGVVFENARSTSSWTLPSHASLLTGLLPSQHGASHPRATTDESVGVGAWPALPLAHGIPTLAERLRNVGYRTGAIVANDVYLNHRYGLDRGFERYDDRRGGWIQDHLALAQFTGQAMRAGHLLYRDAERITDLALDWLGEGQRKTPAESGGEEPFFLMLNYMDAHGPYLPPPPFDRAFTPDQPVDPLRPSQNLRGLIYDRELLYLDSQLERLFDELAARGELDDTVVLLTSDHGEALGQHGFWLHGWTLFDSVVHVPLILKPVGPPEPRREQRPMGGDDVHDLALGALGLEQLFLRKEHPVDGEWFQLEHIPDSSILGNEDLARDLTFWVEDDIKTIVSSTGIVRAFDLKRDPGEEEPLELSPEDKEAARLRADRWWRANPPRQSEAGAYDAELLERASGLGYTDSPAQE